MDSERVIVNAPMSFAGAAQRSWRLTNLARPWALIGTVPGALALLAVWWLTIVVWYGVIIIMGFWIIALPYRLLRRGARKRKIEARQHRELLAAIERSHG